MWSCFRCGLGAEGIPPGICPRCGSVESFDRPRQRVPAKSVALIPGGDLPRIPTGDPRFDDLLCGGFAEGTRLLLWGRGGTGKSRLAMRWATGASNALYISLEMHEMIAAHAARTCGANERRLFVTPTADGFARNARESGARIVVLDSISVVPRREQVELLDALKNWCERRAGLVIVICHENKRGQFKGGSAVQHWCDSEIYLRAAKTGGTIVEVLKSRFCPAGKMRAELGSADGEKDTDGDTEQKSAPELASHWPS